MGTMSHVPRLVVLAVLIILSMAAAFFTWRTHEALEGFDESEAQAVLADGGTAYDRRIYIMKLFDVLLKRKATSDELLELSALDTDAEVLNTVMTRFKLASPTRAQEELLADTGASAAPKAAAVAAAASTSAAAALPPTLVSSTATPLDSDPQAPGPTVNVAAAVTAPIPKPKPKGEVVCLNKEDVQRNIQDIMDHLASFRTSISAK
ncbi:MAG: hypothetical protein WDW38_006570 [Sanguina aurantia]